jgi:hypothetical protein
MPPFGNKPPAPEGKKEEDNIIKTTTPLNINKRPPSEKVESALRRLHSNPVIAEAIRRYDEKKPKGAKKILRQTEIKKASYHEVDQPELEIITNPDGTKGWRRKDLKDIS